MTEASGDDRRPASRRIADELRRSIESGEFAPGVQLPSERQLAATYRTARNTAREAIRLLADSGLVIAEQGRGAFVRRNAPLIRLGNDRYSPRYRDSGMSPFLLECAKQGKTGRFDVLRIERIQPSEDIAARLGVRPAANRCCAGRTSSTPTPTRCTTSPPTSPGRSPTAPASSTPTSATLTASTASSKNAATSCPGSARKSAPACPPPTRQHSSTSPRCAGPRRAAHQHRPGRPAVRADPVCHAH